MIERKEFLKLPLEEQRKILARQANDPALIAYYEDLESEHNKAFDKWIGEGQGRRHL